ncbi:uncharacterized protein LOC113558073 [Rhopalosiphum maidis]|uniref:uncharacterized protein LOC113558073 n=1 Tax=Rhopalosiphum maidis TaxID=43146 RepID=UPI000EFEDC50|nr:uncharacterized protein LOC113558073 [Rhopalosiphum maidis]
MDSEKLIEIVWTHFCLYDLGDPKYSDATHKDKLWKTIGDELNQPGTVCKDRWSNIRDRYRKVLNKKRLQVVKQQKNILKYKYEDQLSFLKHHFQERPITNIESHSNSEEEDNTVQHSTPIEPKRCTQRGSPQIGAGGIKKKKTKKQLHGR